MPRRTAGGGSPPSAAAGFAPGAHLAAPPPEAGTRTGSGLFCFPTNLARLSSPGGGMAGWRCLDWDALPLPPRDSRSPRGWRAALPADASESTNDRATVPFWLTHRPPMPAAAMRHYGTVRPVRSRLHSKSPRAGKACRALPDLPLPPPLPPPKRGPNCVPHRMHLRCKQDPVNQAVTNWQSIRCGACRLQTTSTKTMSFPLRPKGSSLFAQPCPHVL